MLEINFKIAFIFNSLNKNFFVKCDNREEKDDYYDKLYHDSLWLFFHGLILATRKERVLSLAEVLKINVDKKRYWKFNDEEYFLRHQNSWEMLRESKVLTFYSLSEFLQDPIDFWYIDCFRGAYSVQDDVQIYYPVHYPVFHDVSSEYNMTETRLSWDLSTRPQRIYGFDSNNFLLVNVLKKIERN